MSTTRKKNGRQAPPFFILSQKYKLGCVLHFNIDLTRA